MDDKSDHRIWVKIRKQVLLVQLKRWSLQAAFFIGLLLSTLMIFELKNDSSIIINNQNTSKVVKLKDGSEILMLPGSEIEILKSFTKFNRKIKYKGSGFFKIKSDINNPFLIETEDYKVRVLGTQFWLRNSTKEKKIELVEGKILFSYLGQDKLLSNGDVWINNNVVKNKFYVGKNFSRTFNFNKTSFKNVIKQLEEVYQIEIIYPKQFNDKIVNGKFDGNLEEVLSIVSYPFNLNVVENNNDKIQLK
ncbi:FecR family protein [Empedobacter falsenii]